MAKKRLKVGRLAAAMASIVLVMVTVDSLRRDFFRVNTNNSVTVEGYFLTSKLTDDTAADPTIPIDEYGNEKKENEDSLIGNKEGFIETSLSSDQLSKGMLVIVDKDHDAVETSNRGTVNLMDYKNEYYSLVDENVRLNEDAAESLNKMMADYCAATGMRNFIVYGTNDTYTGDGSYCPREFGESKLGYCVDLAVNADVSVISYDGCDTEGWIVENCWKYGFIVRYPRGKEDKTNEAYCPWHLRYVGELHSAVMTKNDLCLEEYIKFIEKYTFDAPYQFTYDHTLYEIYGSSADTENNKARVPVGGNYDISGNNIDGYIITSKK